MDIDQYNKLAHLIKTTECGNYIYKTKIKGVIGVIPDDLILSAMGLTPMFSVICDECGNSEYMLHAGYELHDVVNFDMCVQCGAEIEFKGADNCNVEFKKPHVRPLLM